jgi:GNAT superfamily N-acetyltransferase
MSDASKTTPRSTLLAPRDAADVLDVLCDAFRDYPVMRFVLEGDGAAGGGDPDDPRLRTLIGLFVGARFIHGDRVFGVCDGDRLVAAATTTGPGDPPTPPALAELRAATWSTLGDDARARYEAFANAGDPFYPADPGHHHLNMLGVRRSHAGRGLARVLLEAVHDLSDADPASHGVTLSTESEKNLTLYEHFGYRVLGHAGLDGLETWVLYRPKPAAATTTPPA